MYLTPEEERMLKGDYGEAAALAMKTIVRVGEHVGAQRLIKIDHVHVSGISYVNIGEPGLKFLKRLYEGVKSLSGILGTSNPTCIDLSMINRELFMEEDYAGQKRVNEVLESLGIKPIYTCIPYAFRAPKRDEHLCWGESSAVAMANSYYGARTNREGGPLTILSYIIGRTYYGGLHVPSNRVAKVLVNVGGLEALNERYASLLGLYIGYNIDEIPFIKGIENISYSSVKVLLASSAASGSHALIAIDGITPRGTYYVDPVEKILINKRELDLFAEKISANFDAGEDFLVFIGCPHLDIKEFMELVSIIMRFRRVRKGVEFIISLPYMYLKETIDYARSLKNMGVKVVYGTCPIVSRLRIKPRLIVTDSGKALFYLKKILGVDVTLMDRRAIVEAVMER